MSCVSLRALSEAELRGIRRAWLNVGHFGIGTGHGTKAFFLNGEKLADLPAGPDEWQTARVEVPAAKLKVEIMHAEVRLDDTVIMLGDSTEGWPVTPSHVHVYVLDMDATFGKAVRAGATPLREPVKKDDDDKRGGFTDAWGTSWWIGSKVVCLQQDLQGLARRGFGNLGKQEGPLELSSQSVVAGPQHFASNRRRSGISRRIARRRLSRSCRCDRRPPSPALAIPMSPTPGAPISMLTRPTHLKHQRRGDGGVRLRDDRWRFFP